MGCLNRARLELTHLRLPRSQRRRREPGDRRRWLRVKRPCRSAVFQHVSHGCTDRHECRVYDRCAGSPVKRSSGFLGRVGPARAASAGPPLQGEWWAGAALVPPYNHNPAFPRVPISRTISKAGGKRTIGRGTFEPREKHRVELIRGVRVRTKAPWKPAPRVRGTRHASSASANPERPRDRPVDGPTRAAEPRSGRARRRGERGRDRRSSRSPPRSRRPAGSTS